MQFQVPQFETENKLFGPFTIIQFVYVGISIIISFILFPILTTWFWFAVSSFLVGTSLVIALVKVNGRPVPVFIVEAFRYFWEPKVLTIRLRQLAGTELTPLVSEDPARIQHITPLPPLKNHIPEQMSSAAELPMPPIHQPTETPVTPVIETILPVKLAEPVAPSIEISATPTEVPVPSSASSMPVSTAPAKFMKISPKSDSVISSSPTSAPIKSFKISDSPPKAIPITPAVSATPFVPVPAPIAPIEASPVAEPQRSRLQSLFNKLTTTSSPLLFREESLKQISSQQKGYELVNKLTGETIVARRVDYR